MLPKQHRLSKTAEVKLTTAKGRSFFNPYFIIKTLLVKTERRPRFTVVVSTKVAKSAVVRNRLKRIVRDEIHRHIAGIKPGFYVLILKRAATKIDSKLLRQNIVKALQQSKALLK